MRAPPATELLNIWEWGQASPPVQRALLLLSAAHPDTDVEALADRSIGWRDAQLLALREELFGPHLECLVSCPVCDEQLELALEVADLGSAAPSRPLSHMPGINEDGETMSLSAAGYEVEYRLPNSWDLMAVTEAGNGDDPRQLLLRRCVVAVESDGAALDVEAVPGEIMTALEEHMEQVDPQADVNLSLTCPECSNQWRATFDIVSFLWTEIETWAYRILREVHTLASAYGWREPDILALRPWRRQVYLELARG